MVFLYALIIQIGWSNTGQAECADFEELVAEAKDALWIGDVPLMQMRLKEADVSLECTSSMNPDRVLSSIGDFVLLNAYLSHLEDKENQRTFWLQQSVDLDYWNSNFGPEIENMRTQMQPTAPIAISVLPAFDGGTYELAIDGRIVDSFSVSEGIHWAEVYFQGERLLGQFLHVQTGSFIDVSDVLPDEPTKRPMSVWAAGTVFLATTALSAHTIAMSSHQQYGGAESLSDLDSLRVQTWRWGQGSIVSGTLALLCFTKWAGDTWRIDSSQLSDHIIKDDVE